ncbi:MAG: hypothetical protein U0350_01610 [Caldilineaceae bacterium]
MTWANALAVSGYRRKPCAPSPPGAVLDQAPVTGAEIIWQRGADQSVILTERGDAFETVLTYDGGTGVLRAYQQTLRMPAATTTVVIELAD